MSPCPPEFQEQSLENTTAVERQQDRKRTKALRATKKATNKFKNILLAVLSRIAVPFNMIKSRRGDRPQDTPLETPVPTFKMEVGALADSVFRPPSPIRNWVAPDEWAMRRSDVGGLASTRSSLADYRSSSLVGELPAMNELNESATGPVELALLERLLKTNGEIMERT
jgi:hypothetical protein